MFTKLMDLISHFVWFHYALPSLFLLVDGWLHYTLYWQYFLSFYNWVSPLCRPSVHQPYRHISATTTLIHSFIHSVDMDRAPTMCQALGQLRLTKPTENKANRIPALMELMATVLSSFIHQQQQPPLHLDSPSLSVYHPIILPFQQNSSKELSVLTVSNYLPLSLEFISFRFLLLSLHQTALLGVTSDLYVPQSSGHLP